MNCNMHECDEVAVERSATVDAPFHYVTSGLKNVYLAGIKYRVCEQCGKQEADIPATRQLLEAIARAIIEKHSKLTGPEIRFLRKRLQKKQTEFASLVSLTPEHLSTLENSPDARMEEVRDKFVRTVYRIVAEDAKLKGALENASAFEQWIAAIDTTGRGERIIASWKNRQWNVTTEPLAA